MIRRWLLACFITGIAVAVCWIYVDRPVADYVTANFYHLPVTKIAHDILTLLPAMALCALAFLMVHTMRVAKGDPPAEWTRTPAAGSWAIALAMALTEVLKRLVGRTEIYPSWLLDHVYTVHPVFWRPNSEAFPSGTMLIGTALMAVLWRRVPSGRAAWAAILLFLVLLLILTDSHWVSDIIAGTFIGATVGWITSATMPGESAAEAS